MTDHERAEKFGLLMLSEDDEEEKEAFNEIVDLDEISDENEDDSDSCEKLSNLQHLLANYVSNEEEEQEDESCS